MIKNENIYAMVADRIIEQLEKGIIPWHKPWFGTPEGAFSRSTKKPYSLINQLLLEKPGEYLTFKQVKEAKGHVKKGAKAKTVVFFKPYKITETDEKGEKVEKTIPLLRYYQVFHIDDTEGVEPIEKPKSMENEPIEAAEAIIYNYIHSVDAPKFVNDKPSNEAFYRPSTDTVVVPMITQYENVEEYYSTAFHELTHSTLKETRCNRKAEGSIAAFGSEDYSKEELVAELGAASLVNISGIETEKSFNNSASYIQSWLKALKNDKKMITLAATKAGQAVDYITNAIPVEGPEDKVEKPEIVAATEAAAEAKKSPIQKAQEAVYAKYTKKATLQGNYNGYNWFNNSHALMGTKILEFEGDLQVDKLVKGMIEPGADDTVDIDMLKFDIKAIKAMKEKSVLIKTGNDNYARFDISLIQDAIKFLGIKKGTIDIKLSVKKPTIALTFINENGYALVLNQKEDNAKEAYDLQCEKVAAYYKALNS